MTSPLAGGYPYPSMPHNRGASYFAHIARQRDEIRMLTGNTSGLPGRVLPEFAHHMQMLEGKPDMQASYYVALAVIQGRDPQAAEIFVNAMDQSLKDRDTLIGLREEIKGHVDAVVQRGAPHDPTRVILDRYA